MVQEPVYQNLLDRYNLNDLKFNSDHATIFAIYDLKRTGQKYELYPTRIESSTTDALFRAFRTNPDIPSKDDFVRKLSQKIEDKMGLKLQFRSE